MTTKQNSELYSHEEQLVRDMLSALQSFNSDTIWHSLSDDLRPFSSDDIWDTNFAEIQVRALVKKGFLLMLPILALKGFI
jgi:hypothetical protein